MHTAEDHIIGRLESGENGPLLIAIGGMHGNERAGIEAIERVLHILESSSNPFHGRFIGLRGNIGALKKEQRYQTHDLNRIWTPKMIEHLQEGSPDTGHPEYLELFHLHGLIERELSKPYTELAIIDLHTTSANAGIFVVCPDSEKSKKLVHRLHAPVILNLHEDLEGTAIQYYWNREIISFAIEGGHHYSPESIDKLESSIWICLDYLGNVHHSVFDNVEYHDMRLIHASDGLPHFCKMVQHHRISPDDGFSMRPGYSNFQQIEKGEILADDKNGEIRSSADGFILMPLYQAQGDDGFFVVEEMLHKKAQLHYG